MTEPAVVAALVAGSVVVLTTIVNLAFSWRQDRNQRQFSLRQQVYLDACAWAASGSEYLVSLARLDLDDIQLAGIVQKSLATYYRVHVVGAQSTVSAFSAASEYLGIEAAKLMMARIRLRNDVARLETLQGEAERHASYLAQATTIIDSIPKASPSPELLAAVPQMVAEFTAARDRLSRVEAEIGTLQGAIRLGQEQLLAECMNAAAGYGRCLMAANVAARSELGLRLDEGQYRESVEAATTRSMAAVKDLVAELKRNS